MKKSEFENKIKELHLEKIPCTVDSEAYTKNIKEYYKDKKRDNYYGCYYYDKEKVYIIFFTDAERGVEKNLGHYRTEEEAYEHLFEKIKNWK